MIKEKDILIRIEQETKQKASERVKLIGLSLSAWVRTLIIKELNKEA